LKNSILLAAKVKTPDRVLGLARDFYHAMAQVLSVARGEKITLKQMGEYLLTNIEVLDRTNDTWLKELVETYCMTYEEYKEHLSKLASGEDVSDSKVSHFVSGKLISAVYNITLNLISVDINKFHAQTIPIQFHSSPSHEVTIAQHDRHYVPIFSPKKWKLEPLKKKLSK